MHTFFINTSNRKFESYRQLLDIYRDTQRLISIDCPIDRWQETGNGHKNYENCVRKMGEYIDNYDDVNNEYNLVIYVDLNAFDVYSPTLKDTDRYPCLQALYALFTHYIKETLMKELSNVREPQEAVIIFEQEKQPVEVDVTEGAGMDKLHAQIKRLLSLPGDETFSALVKEYYDNGKQGVAEGFIKRIRSGAGKELLAGLLMSYVGEFDTFLKEAESYVGQDQSIDNPLQAMLTRIHGGLENDTKNMKIVPFVTNSRAAGISKRENTRRELRLYFYLLDCIQQSSVYVDGQARPFPEMTDEKWKVVEDALKQKKVKFGRKLEEIENLNDRFSGLGLAPTLYALNTELFGLDEYGERAVDYEVFDEVPDDEGKSEDDAQSDASHADINDGKIITEETRRTILAVSVERKKIIEEYPDFNDGKKEEKDQSEEKLGQQTGNHNNGAERNKRGKKGKKERVKIRNRREAKYTKKIKDKLKEHDEFQKKLGQGVADVLVHYAGSSGSNVRQLLKKRNPLVLEDGLTETRTYPYAKTEDKNGAVNKLPDDNPDRAELLSQSAYQTAEEDFLASGAGRISALADIQKQVDWASTAIRDITKSLEKLKLVAIGMFVGIFAFYLPFFILGWDAITKNLMTVAVALSSFALPVALMYGVLLAMTALQYKRYEQVWETFEAKAIEAKEQSEETAKMYHQLLSVYIPSLRWLYEYKMDVEFYLECCRMAQAKCDHHKKMLSERVTAVWNIVQDLEPDNMKLPPEEGTTDNIEYTEAYCCGDNSEVYLIVGQDLLDKIR